MHEWANGVGKRSVFCSCVRSDRCNVKAPLLPDGRINVSSRNYMFRIMASLEALLIIDFYSHDNLVITGRMSFKITVGQELNLECIAVKKC